MPLIPSDALPHFENAVYFPMLITILEQDREAIEKGPFKLKSPYLNLIEKAINQIQKESKQTHDYFKQNKMKLIKNKSEDTFTEYIFVHNGYQDSRRYLNVRLKNRTEELIKAFFEM